MGVEVFLKWSSDLLKTRRIAAPEGLVKARKKPFVSSPISFFCTLTLSHPFSHSLSFLTHPHYFISCQIWHHLTKNLESIQSGLTPELHLLQFLNWLKLFHLNSHRWRHRRHRVEKNDARDDSRFLSRELFFPPEFQLFDPFSAPKLTLIRYRKFSDKKGFPTNPGEKQFAPNFSRNLDPEPTPTPISPAPKSVTTASEGPEIVLITWKVRKVTLGGGFANLSSKGPSCCSGSCW